MAEELAMYPEPTVHQMHAQAALRDYRLHPTVGNVFLLAVSLPVLCL
jgi:hypothetical protein